MIKPRLGAYFVEWYKLPAGSAAPLITEEKLFYFYNLQPQNNTCLGDPAGPGRFVESDPGYPREDMLYATLLLNASAELSMVSGGAAARTFQGGPGVVSFEVPLFPGEQRLTVTRHTGGGVPVVLADVVGSEHVNASTNPAVIARCDHQTFTGSALLS